MLRAVVFVHTALLLGCERGCLSKRIQGLADAPALGTIDCPDGLARCRDGVIERSRLAQVSSRSPSGCPWEQGEACPGSCVENVIVPADSGRQLCRVDSGGWLEKHGPATADTCKTGSRWACEAAQVIDCPSAQAIAVCLHGCALPELDDDVPAEDAETILCAR